MGNSPWGQLLNEKKKFHHKLNVGLAWEKKLSLMNLKQLWIKAGLLPPPFFFFFLLLVGVGHFGWARLFSLIALNILLIAKLTKLNLSFNSACHNKVGVSLGCLFGTSAFEALVFWHAIVSFLVFYVDSAWLCMLFIQARNRSLSFHQMDKNPLQSTFLHFVHS